MPTLVNDIKSINKLIKSAHTNSTKFAEILHDAAYNCVFHAINTGDWRPLQVLYEGLTPVAANSLRVWATKFAPFTFNTKSNSFSIKKDRAHDAAMLAAVGPMSFKPAKKPPVKHAFNLADEIGKLVERATKNSANGTAVAKLLEAGRLA